MTTEGVFSQHKPSILERFGLFYISLFHQRTLKSDIFTLQDEEIRKRINKRKLQAEILTILVSIISVLPLVWVDIHFSNDSFWKHYGWLILATVLSVAAELYVLFLIALKLAHQLKEELHIEVSVEDPLFKGAFNLNNILARTALELPDPELKILGIDPFKRISKKNLLIIGLLYKAKIMISNVIIKYSLLFFIGKSLFGVSILYEAVFVECFWNYLIVQRISKETRLRLFGFLLANKIVANVKNEQYLFKLSKPCKIVCLRAIGNAVVMTQNYHPNMIILLMRFKEIMPDVEAEKLDDWPLFLEGLYALPIPEQNFCMDLFTVATAFDGKISVLEKLHMKDVYREHYALYIARLDRLVDHLSTGKINLALQECQLDLEAG